MANKHMKKMFNMNSYWGNANGNHEEVSPIYLTPIRIAIIRKIDNKCWEDREPSEASYFVRNNKWWPRFGEQSHNSSKG